MFGLISLLCFLAAFVEYCFGVRPRPFDPAGLVILGLLFLAAHVLWTGRSWRRT